MASFSSIPPDSKSVISDLTVDVMTRHTNQIRQKAVFVGDSGVGKTSIILRINENKFKDNYEVSKFIVINFYISNILIGFYWSRFFCKSS